MIGVEERDGVVVVRLAHGKVNALDLELLRTLIDTMRGLADGPAVVLTGTGGVFSAGVDLRRVVAGGPDYVREFLPVLSAAFLAVYDHPRPVVAAVNGHAIAGGCVLVAGCDVRLMAAGTIGLSELLVGVPFPTAALEIVRSAAGPAIGDLALTGRRCSPDEAVRVGLVDAVVPGDELLDRAVARAGALGRVPAAVYALTKEQVHRPVRRRIEQWAPVDDPRVTQAWASESGRAAIAGYLDGLARRT